MIKENMDRLHKIPKTSIIIIVVFILRPNRLELFDLRATWVTSERNFLHALAQLFLDKYLHSSVKTVYIVPSVFARNLVPDFQNTILDQREQISLTVFGQKLKIWNNSEYMWSTERLSSLISSYKYRKANGWCTVYTMSIQIIKYEAPKYALHQVYSSR